MNLTVLADPAAVAQAAAEAFVEAVAAGGDRPAVCLSGGSTPQAAHHLLASSAYAGRVDWERVHVFFGDERRVPLGDARSNYHSARESLLDHVPVPDAHVHALTDADQYEGLLRAFFGEAARFDLLFLGMGDDGHTASLFPGSVSLLEQERWVIDPPDVVAGMARHTLTLPALDAARRTLFLVTGAAKAPVLGRIRAGERFPAGMVQGAEWLVDAAAAGASA
ncbi:MAG TPA: 6-phosphogluconolactonase [Gaiellales bacterium]